MNELMADHHSAPIREGVDPTPYLADALSDVVHDLMWSGKHGDYLLADFLLDTYYGGDAALMITDLQTAVCGESFDNVIRYRWEEALTKHLEGSETVLDRANEMARDA